MFVFRNSLLIMVCAGVLSPAVWAQKNITKAVSAAAKKTEMKITDLYFPPYRMAGQLQRAAANRSRQAFFSNWNLTTQQLERQSAKHVVRPANQSVAKAGGSFTPKTQLAKPGMSEVVYAHQNTQFLRDYLQSHQNQWPVYQEKDTDQNRVVRRIMGLMEGEDNTPTLLEIKRELIRLREHSSARSPQEIKEIISDMLAYGVVPVRVYPGSSKKHTEEELELGEDLAFAILAYQVPMENNPWNIPGMAEIADQVNTYNAMRRADPLFEGIPTTYTNEYGMQDNNIPVLTRAEYVAQQQAFAQAHPFTYALAAYWEEHFGTAFYRIFNHLDPVGKQAVLFNAPTLPHSVDTQSPVFTTYYNQALERWTRENGREPRLRIRANQQRQFEEFLRSPQMPASEFLFKNQERLFVDFLDLHYPEQLEVLLAVWQQHKVPAHQLLNRLGKPQPYF